MMDVKEETVMVDIYPVEKSKAPAYRAARERCAVAAQNIISEYGVKAVRETRDPQEGEGIFGYNPKGEVELSVLLDPFEVPVMDKAMADGRLEQYIAAANGIPEACIDEVKEALRKECALAAKHSSGRDTEKEKTTLSEE